MNCDENIAGVLREFRNYYRQMSAGRVARYPELAGQSEFNSGKMDGSGDVQLPKNARSLLFSSLKAIFFCHC